MRPIQEASLNRRTGARKIWMSRWRHSGAHPRALVVALTCLCLAAPAAGQSEQANRAIDVNLFRPSASRHALITTELSTVAEPGEWLIGFLYEYQHRPLIVRSFGASVDDVVQGQHTAHLLFSVGLPWHIELNVDMPVMLYMSGTGGQYLYPSLGGLDAQAFGDLRLTPKISVLRKAGFGDRKSVV